jgi:nucleoid-associated protein YgaU
VPSAVSKPASLKVAALSGQVVTPPQSTSAASIKEQVTSPSPVKNNSGKLQPLRSIVVEDGDTLSSLAEANLGSNNHEAMQRFLKANPLLINPDLIHPGQIVFLPSDSD